jgi:serine/threonine protein kinase/Leucine-rich repeat (LRR) protein
MERVVAIKMLPTATMKDAAATARFQREVVAAAKLSHPNIVAAHDADEANGVHFLVMEYAEGSDLSALVKKNGPLPVAKAVNYILQAARGLEFAHKHGVVHRDIKPANLLLSSEGTVKILDMGLARIDSEGDTATQAELTGTGMVLGTVDYMAPEQALDTKHVDGRADIYSLGCSLYYLITAHAAYNGNSLMAKLLAHREQPIPSLGAEVPEELQAVFQRMVAKKIQDRYQTMTEVVAALEQCSSSQPTSGSFQQSVSTSPDADVLTFLRDIPTRTTQKPKPKAKPVNYAAPVKTGNRNRKLVLGAVGAGLLGLAILAGVLLKLRTKDGTLVVEVSQPDAVVQVLDADGKVEISQPGGKGAISISVDPGKHRLKVEKDGFQFFAQDFEMESGGTASIKATLEPVTAVAGQSDKPWNSLAFQKWMKDVAAIPAEKQVDAVAKKLQELNPGFDGKVSGEWGNDTPKIENGVVTEMGFATGNVTDISPVRALIGLKRLSCPGSFEFSNGGHWSNLSDLSPLQGMKLTDLNCYKTSVSDLSPLKGMPLTHLYCWTTAVSDLSPLRGMPLTELGCNDCDRVSDLTPLEDTKLATLTMNGTKVVDLSPLKKMQLVNISCYGCPVADLSPLANCKSLQSLDIRSTKVTAASVAALQKALPNCKIEWDEPATIKATLIEDKPWFKPAFLEWQKEVAAMPAEEQVKAVVKKLKELNFGFDGRVTPKIEGGVVTEVEFVTDNLTDISPVRALTGLKKLVCHGSGQGKGILSDLSPLKGIPLTRMDCGWTKVSDLSPLEGMPLVDLNCGTTHVSDLSPLRGMPLTLLGCEATNVLDLSPLKGMPLKILSCHSTQLNDLSPLKGMPSPLRYSCIRLVAACRIAIVDLSLHAKKYHQGDGHNPPDEKP